MTNSTNIATRSPGSSTVAFSPSVGRLLRPGMPPASLDDLAYAERRYELRERGGSPADSESR
jgi:hypothetical protein